MINVQIFLKKISGIFRRISTFFYTLSIKFKVKREFSIYKELSDCYNSNSSHELIMGEKSSDHIKINSSSIIWTLWLQGIDNAPEIVKSCINSFKNIGEGKNIIILTEENYRDYTNLPEAIIIKYTKGIISKTAFSELIRLDVLSVYGGLWLDATMFVPYQFKIKYEDFDFFSPKEKIAFMEGDTFGLFPVFLLYAKKEYDPIIHIRNMLVSYWLVHDKQIDYFLIDYCFKFTYLNDETFRRDVDKVPVCGTFLHFFERYLINVEFNGFLAENISIDPLGCYKLNHKNTHHKLKRNKSTFYSHFLLNK